MSTYVSGLMHYGTWDMSTRDEPVLCFMEKYVVKVESLDLSGPFHAWYAPSCNFYNTDGVVYKGGDEVWTWMQTLFAPFLGVHHNIKTVRLWRATPRDADRARDAQWVMMDTETAFTFKNDQLKGRSVSVPRLLVFMVGRSEVVGQGTDGLQILAAKAWWDSGALLRSIADSKAEQVYREI